MASHKANDSVSWGVLFLCSHVGGWVTKLKSYNLFFVTVRLLELLCFDLEISYKPLIRTTLGLPGCVKLMWLEFVSIKQSYKYW